MKISEVTELIEKHRYCEKCGSDEILGVFVIRDTFIRTCSCGQQLEKTPKKTKVFCLRDDGVESKTYDRSAEAQTPKLVELNMKFNNKEFTKKINLTGCGKEEDMPINKQIKIIENVGKIVSSTIFNELGFFSGKDILERLKKETPRKR